MVYEDPDAHRGAAYTLTGAHALGFDEVARLLTDVLGRTIRYQPAGVAGYLRHLRHRHLPMVQCLVQTVLHTGLRRGQAERVDPTLGRLLGRAPTPLAAYIRDYRHLWASR
ncbi:hypothetical protein ACQP2F_13905 [Actinoplanes sp. CA-030573]|uniref:hypothetical protein n=1 Tax=Actinoplanes sp. CA-030573 TaxID=3239898 RepID=UPI003D8D9245